MKHPEASQAEPWTAHRQAMPRAVARALADPLRWRIVELLASEQLRVNHLAAELEAPQPLVSHHLKALRQAGVVAADPYRSWTLPDPSPFRRGTTAGDSGCRRRLLSQ